MTSRSCCRRGRAVVRPRFACVAPPPTNWCVRVVASGCVGGPRGGTLGAGAEGGEIHLWRCTLVPHGYAVHPPFSPPLILCFSTVAIPTFPMTSVRCVLRHGDEACRRTLYATQEGRRSPPGRAPCWRSAPPQSQTSTQSRGTSNCCRAASGRRGSCMGCTGGGLRTAMAGTRGRSAHLTVRLSVCAPYLAGGCSGIRAACGLHTSQLVRVWSPVCTCGPGRRVPKRVASRIKCAELTGSSTCVRGRKCPSHRPAVAASHTTV